MTTALLFIVSGVLVVGACELFTNAVEWAGYSLRLGTGATGSLLAAIGTALPETFVPVIALATHVHGADSVAMGAVLGAPFLITTVATAAAGFAVMLRRSRPVLTVVPRQARQDLVVVLVGLSAALVCIVLPFAARVPIGIALLATYVLHVRRTLSGSSSDVEMPEPLHLVRWHSSALRPRGVLIGTQLVVAVVLLAVASELFVDALDSVAMVLGVPALILALIVVPLATELPESLNGVLWVRSGDDALAFGNLAGAAAWQATVLAFIGVTFTSWRPGFGGILSALLTLVTAAALLVALWSGRARGALLLLAALPWAGYVIAEAATGGRLGA